MFSQRVSFSLVLNSQVVVSMSWGKKGVPCHYYQILKISYWKLESCLLFGGLLLRGQEFNCQFLKIHSSVKCQSFLCIAWLNWALLDCAYKCIYSSCWIHDSTWFIIWIHDSKCDTEKIQEISDYWCYAYIVRIIN